MMGVAGVVLALFLSATDGEAERSESIFAASYPKQGGDARMASRFFAEGGVAPASAADITRPDSGGAGSADFLADQLGPPDFASAPAFGGGFVSSSARTVLAAGFVFSLIFGLAFFAKKVLLKGVGVGSRGRFIRVADTLFLGPRKSLWVVEAYGQKFLLATVGSGLQFLSKIDEPREAVKRAASETIRESGQEGAAFEIESNWPKPVPVNEFLKAPAAGRSGSWLQRIKKAQMENRKQGT